MYAECHAHLMMDGVNYKAAAAFHAKGVQEADIRNKLEQYRRAGITWIRDGGDRYGVSSFARTIAPEYGITYRTPLYAIHKKGHYGGIVGYGFETWKEYEELVKNVRLQGGNFIKVMFSGIMDFAEPGKLSEPPLSREDIREMVHIAHEEGFAVMAHVNGAEAVRNAVEAGTDSIEHGNFMDEEALHALAESGSVWVPTYVTIANLSGGGRFPEESVQRLKELAGERIRRGYELGARIALGSDAGAWRVGHGQGLLDEYREIISLLTGSEQAEAQENTSPPSGGDHAQESVLRAEAKRRLLASERIIWDKF